MYEHTYFDMSILDGTSLVQADSLSTYFLAKQSSRSLYEYQFVRANHTTQKSEIVYQKIQLPGYTMFGMCIFNGSLDYLIGVEDATGDIQIIRYTMTTDDVNPLLQKAVVYDYKVVDIDPNIELSGNLYIHCQYDGTYKGVNTYSIGLLGYYFNENAISNYYFAKFSTKYNLTEYFIVSQNPYIMEVPRKVYMDTENRRVYLAIEVNKNRYYDQTVYAPGDQPGVDNSNVAIICYQWTHGVRQWITLIGSEIYSDVFVDLEQYENNVYAVVNSVTSKFSSNSSQTDIYYYKMRSENGVIIFKQIFGSPGDDKVLDMSVTFNGVYLYAMINGPFQPHRENNKWWQTIGSNTNLAIIHIDFTDKIVDIEAWDYTNIASNNYINPYPSKFFVVALQEVQQFFVFVTHRTNLPVDRNGGIFITYFVQPFDIFIQKSGCPGIGCSFCSNKLNTKCLQCMPIYQLFQHNCYEGQCPQFTYMVQNITWQSQKYCKQCHYSCQTCNGPREDQCSSCCINGNCGPTYNRVPQLGKCLCPQDTAEVNGICNYGCVLSMAARLDQKCLTQCPTNSYPMLKYDGLVAQERTQFDPSQPNACEKYSYHLQFTKQSQGLALPGPQNQVSMPDEFNMAFWVMPTDLNTQSYFINLFGRAFVWAESANTRVFYKFQIGPKDVDFIQPTYPAVAANRMIQLSNWNYISVSQRQTKTDTNYFYEITIGIIQGNFGTIQAAGSTKGTQQVVRYSAFQNIIFIGGQSDLSSGTSFSGYLKEVQLYTNFRGLAQMQDAFSRALRLYSYDDRSLIAYWKLSEQYTQQDAEYNINDYSLNMNSLAYSRNSKPSYPFYTLDASKTINLCYMHDIKNCLSLDYSGMPPVATSSRNYIRLPTLNLKEYTRYSTGNLLRQQDDMIFYVPQNVNCSELTQILAKMNYTYDKSLWEVKDDKYNPMYLPEGFHYQQCYFINSADVVFNLAQVYVAYRPRTVDPSNDNIYNKTNNFIQFMTGFGDQAYGDILRLSRQCDTPGGAETEFVRSNVPGYDRVDVSVSFNLSGTFYFCWFPMFMRDYLPYPIYESIHNLYWQIQYEPTLLSIFRTDATVNQDMVMLQMTGTFIDGDLITMAWQGLQYADCNPLNFMGQTYTYNHSSWPGIWMGFDTGIHGVLDTNMDELQVCWKPGAVNAPSVYIRIKKESLGQYQMRIYGYDSLQNQRCPELYTFNPPYGSSLILETDRVIQFSFKSQQVIPCKMDNTRLGMIRIYRGAVKSDGTYVKIPTSANVLWENTQLDEDRGPDPFQQGDLICTQTGQCSIILSQQNNIMKAGEVYYLTFYPYSFMTIFQGTKYYLFNNGFAYGTPAYDHFFMCRSFNIYPSQQLINGMTVVVQGVDLRQKTITAKYNAGGIEQSIFYTKAINLRLQVFNTDQYQCIFNRPTATVAMEDVYDTYFIIRNLELRECNSGQLFADIEFLRGIRDDNADYSYLKAEKIYNIQIGSIGCDPSCKVCNGTLDTNCMICSNPTYNLFMGKCYPVCPPKAPRTNSYSITYQNLLMTQTICTSDCPLGMYSDDQNNCIQCNADCQTCQSSTIASCQSCNPIKYLFNGMCVTQCPQPHHMNNLTDYLCHQVSQPKYLQVKILSLGFMSRIPKDKIVYLKVDINNTGGGNITSILWQQMEPTDPHLQVFTNDSDGTHSVRFQMVRINNNVLMNIGVRQGISVNVTVTNSMGDIAYDIYEFFVNASPFTGDLLANLAGKPGVTNNFAAIDQLIQVNLIKWYDSSDDTKQMLKMKIHLIRSTKVGNTVQTSQFTVADLVQSDTLYFTIPPIQMDMRIVTPNDMNQPGFGLVNITYCVSAIDMFNAISAKCADLINVQNKIQFFTDYSSMAIYLSKLNFVGNITNILLASNTIFQVLPSPARPNTQPHICTGPIHCNNKGFCSSQTGVNYCQCDLGYFGTYCDFKEDELPSLRAIANNILNTVYSYVTSKTITQFDIEIIANVVRGLTNHPDIVDDENFFTVLKLLEINSNSDLYAHQPYDVNVTTMMFEAYTNAQLKIAHSFKLRKALKNNLLLGMGMNLMFFQTAFTLHSNPSDITFNTSNYLYYISDYNKTNSLIGGVLAPRQTRTRLLINETLLYTNWSRRWDATFTQYCQRVLFKMHPMMSNYTFRGKAFDLMLMHRRPNQIYTNGDPPAFIKQKDAYWNFPNDIFVNQPGVASSFHELKFRLMKYVLNPLQFEPQPGAFLESNVTAVQFFSLSTQQIPISLPNNSANWIEYREPYNLTRGYSAEWIRCMSWDNVNYQFINDGSCGFLQLWDLLPCYNSSGGKCDSVTQVNTTISLCRCKNMTGQLAVVAFQVNASTFGAGYQNSIYTDFFAMKYWQTSFGFIIVLSGAMVFAIGHILIWLIDGRLRRNLIIRLREKARQFELKYGAAMMREDGVFIKIESKKERRKAIKSQTAAMASKSFKEVDADKVQDLQKKEDDGNQESEENNGFNVHKPHEGHDKKDPPKKRKHVLPMKKKIFEDEQVEAEGNSSSEDEEMIKKIKLKGAINGQDNEEEIKRQMEEMRREIEERQRREAELDAYSSSEDDIDVSKLSEKQRKQFENQRKLIRNLKSQKYPHYLYHELMEVTEEMVEGMTQTEFRKKIMSFVRKLPLMYQKDVRESLAEIKANLYSTDEELKRSMKHVFKDMRKERERSQYRVKNMIINGSLPLSLIFVTSILSPRHIRWTLLMCNIIVLWFLCAVYFNNTKDPLVVPDFNTQASSLAVNELWISFVAPWGSMAVMFLISCFLKMPNSQFVNIVTLRQLEVAVIEYKREQQFRFFFGYLIVTCIMGYICKYVITFTATYGWKISWVWYYTGITAMFFQFIFADPLIALIHVLVFKCSHNAGRFCYKFRSMSQAYNETFDLSDGEIEERKQKELEKKEQERKKKDQPQKKGKPKKKKKKVQVEEEDHDLFGETPVVLPHKEEDSGHEEPGGLVPNNSGSDKGGKSSGHETAADGKGSTDQLENDAQSNASKKKKKKRKPKME